MPTNPNLVEAKLQLQNLLKEKVLRKCREDSLFFTDYIFNFKNSSQMHRDWHNFMSTNKIGQMLASRNSGKSQHMIGRMLWEIGRNPNIRIKIATETEDLAQKSLGLVSNTILRNEKLREVFPNLRPDPSQTWAKFALTVMRNDPTLKDATIEGAGVLSGVTGGRADWLLFDDISGLRNALYLPKMREQVKEAFYSNWLNMLDGDQAKWFMVGTPWHIEDIVSEVRNNTSIPKAKEWWVGDRFESPWPERFDSDYYKGRLQILKARHYNRAFRGLAISDEEAWINAQAVESCKNYHMKAWDVLSNKDLPKFTGVDLGHREGPKACPTVVYTIALTPNGQRIPCDVKIMYESNMLEVCRVIIGVWQDYNPREITVENNNAQQYLIDTIKSIGPTGLPVKGYYTGIQKLDVNIGVPSMLAEIEGGRWVVPLGAGGDHDETCLCSFCKWISEVKSYPHATTDTVMASWLALEGLRRLMERGSGGGFSVWSFR
jgi:hypothetical protein